MLEFLSLQPETFGIDINDLALRIIKLRKKRGGFALASYNEVAIKPGIIKEGVIQDEVALIKIIQSACSSVKGEKLRTKHAVISLPEEKSFSQVVQLPLMEPKELAMAVPFEAENYIPLPIDKVYLDFEPLVFQNQSQKHMNVLVNVMPKAIIDAYVSSFKKAGLVPYALEVESQAIVRALTKPGPTKNPLVFIDFGETKTSFVIFAENAIRFTCSIPISSSQLTHAIAKELEIPFAKAEELKLKHGLESGKLKRHLRAMAPILEDLALQIKKYLAFYYGHVSHAFSAPEPKLEKVVLCGGGSNLKKFPEFLAQKLKMNVELGNPFTNVISEKKGSAIMGYKKGLSFVTAMGLALRNHD